MFNERKAAQMAAFFLGQTKEGKMSHLKLMKLLYLSDRAAVRAFGWPISGDRMVSMPQGPVLSQTLDLMGGYTKSQSGGWESWISDKENHQVSLCQPLNVEALDELAPAELDVLGCVWNEFGAMNQWTIRDWTHAHCAEWQDPNGSSIPIQFTELARAVGFDEAAANDLAERYQDQQKIDRIFAAL
jgi:uncharacterized phage-associated protein